MAELNKIKAEKARDEAEKEAGRREEEEQIRMENILSGEIICARQSFQFSFAGNPLLKEKYSDTGKTDMKIKKRWDDDVVFKNCSRAEPDERLVFNYDENSFVTCSPGNQTSSMTVSAMSSTKGSWTSTSSRMDGIGCQ